MGHQVFLSYSHKDIDVMRRIRNDLHGVGLNVWVDENLTPGLPSWKGGIESAIEGSATLVVLLSPDAKKSEWIEKELDYAHTYGIPIIPVLVSGDERDAIPFDLISTQRLDMRANYDTGIRQLIAGIQNSAPTARRSSSPDVVQPNAQFSQRPASDKDELDAWNLLDQLRLMWWLFLSPKQLLAYKAHFGNESVASVTAWLVSTLAWLVTAVPILAFSLGTIPQTGSAQTGVGLFVAWMLILIGWFIAGWLVGSTQAKSAALIAFVITAIVTITVGFMIGNVVGVDLAANTIERTVVTLGLGIAFGVGFALRNNAVGIVGGAVAGIVFYIAIFGKPIGSDASATILGLVGMTLLVTFPLRQSLASGHLSVFNWLVVAAGTVTYAALIWLYFLGGWSVLAH